NPPLALLAPAVAAGLPVSAHHTMTRDDEGHPVAGAGASHGTGGLGVAERGRDLAVTAGFAAGNLLEGPPDPPLEGRGLEIQGKGPRSGAALYHRPHGVEPVAKGCVVAFDLGVRVLPPEGGLQRAIVVAEGDGADAPLRGGHQQPAEGGGRRGVANL